MSEDTSSSVEYIIDPVLQYLKKGEIKLMVNMQKEKGDKPEAVFIEAFIKKPSAHRIKEAIDVYLKARNIERKKQELLPICYSKIDLHSRTAVALVELDEAIANAPDVEVISEKKPVVEKEQFSVNVNIKAQEIIDAGQEMQHLKRTISEYHYGSDVTKKALIYCKLSSHIKAVRTLHASLTGPSTTGKSHLMTTTLYTMPLHTVLFYATVSEKFLVYACKDDRAFLKNKTICIDEVKKDMYDTVKSLTTPDAIEWKYGTVKMVRL